MRPSVAPPTPTGAAAGRPTQVTASKLVRYERSDAAAVLTIDRPERRNAVDGATAEALKAGYEQFVGDDDARVLVLTGAGGVSFCAGADLKAIETLGARIEDPAGPLGFTRLTAPKPTIAAIEGWCLAGGLELALWCDLRIASSGSRLGFPERRWGVPLIDGGTQRLPRIVGLGRALELILSGRIVSAEEALGWGMLTEIAAKPLDRALELAQQLASFPQDTMLADRWGAIEGLGLPLAEGLELEARTGIPTVLTGVRGAERFAAGEGRGGAGVSRPPI
jgi:enoyl-CoA hydratase